MIRAVSSAGRFVKICGITRVADALHCAEAGASAIGLNFILTSKRRVDEATARKIVEAVRGRVQTVAVVADRPVPDLRELRERVGVDWLQLHGGESPDELSALLPGAFKAIRIGAPGDAERAAAFGGELLLADALVPGELGGTGTTFEWSLVAGLARARKLLLAGGLTPDNVADAVRAVDPWGVDVASGVESAPGIKDPDEVTRFIRAARGRSP